jgi:hypothetical protein
LWLPLILKPQIIYIWFKNYSKWVKSYVLLLLILYVAPNLCQIVYTVACQHPQCLLFWSQKKIYKIIVFEKKILKFLRSDLWKPAKKTGCSRIVENRQAWEPDFFCLGRKMIPGTVLISLLFFLKSKNQGGSHTDGSLKLVRTAQHW